MENFGKYLGGKRTEKGVSIEYIAMHSALNENIILALERGDYGFFNSSFYFSNFLNEYLDYLNIDKGWFFSEFSGEIESLKKKDNVNISKSLNGLRYSNFRSRKFVVKGIVLGLLLIFLFYLIFINRENIFSYFDKDICEIPQTKMFSKNFLRYENDFSPLTVNLKFTGSCWIRVFRSDKLVEERVFSPGESIQFKGYELKFIIGNPSMVDLFINGVKTEKFKKITRSISIKLTPSTIEQVL